LPRITLEYQPAKSEVALAYKDAWFDPDDRLFFRRSSILRNPVYIDKLRYYYPDRIGT